jgi:hypothetical protein
MEQTYHFCVINKCYKIFKIADSKRCNIYKCVLTCINKNNYICPKCDKCINCEEKGIKEQDWKVCDSCRVLFNCTLAEVCICGGYICKCCLRCLDCNEKLK